MEADVPVRHNLLEFGSAGSAQQGCFACKMTFANIGHCRFTTPKLILHRPTYITALLYCIVLQQIRGRRIIRVYAVLFGGHAKRK